MTVPSSPLATLSLVFSGAAALILLAYLVKRPALHHATKVWLFLGLGAFPISAAMAGNFQGFEATKDRAFCASCHVMDLHTGDSDNPASQSLSARHARNKLFGDQNCYVCHADYGMYGTISTKLGGMKHVWKYYTEYRTTSMDDAKKTIALYAPYPNDNCMQCHSTKDQVWLSTPEHNGLLDDIRADRVSCASGGCHGFAHPYWKSPAELVGSGQGGHISAEITNPTDGGTR